MKIYAKKGFREKRLLRGHTLVSLGLAADASKQTMGQVERRVNGIGPEKAKKVAQALHVEFEEIFEFVERGEHE